MSQTRIQDYGSLVVASSLKVLAGSFVRSSILSGNEFVVDASNRMRINPGTAITYQGVIIIEDEPQFLGVSLGSNPADYTVYYAHQDQLVSGGVPAILTIEPGLFDSASIQGVILGYVRYPGGAVPLNSSMFIQPKAASIGSVTPTFNNAPMLVPVKGQGYVVTGSSGGTVTLNDGWDNVNAVMYLLIQNASASLGTITLTFPFKVNDVPFARLQMRLGTDINATVSPFFVDSVANSSPLSALPITGAPIIALYNLDLPRGATQTPNNLVYVQLQVSLAVGKSVKLQTIGLSEFNLPV